MGSDARAALHADAETFVASRFAMPGDKFVVSKQSAGWRYTEAPLIGAALMLAAFAYLLARSVGD
jgi:hypothetical protein